MNNFSAEVIFKCLTGVIEATKVISIGMQVLAGKKALTAKAFAFVSDGNVSAFTCELKLLLPLTENIWNFCRNRSLV